MQQEYDQKTAETAAQERGWAIRSPLAMVGIFLRGIFMGAADIVPGVSGGTMAFIFGIYEELINSIKTIGQRNFIDAVLHFRLREAISLINWTFLLPLGLGVVAAIFALSGHAGVFFVSSAGLFVELLLWADHRLGDRHRRSHPALDLGSGGGPTPGHCWCLHPG